MNTQLVNAEGLLTALFAENVRPSIRWVRSQQRSRNIPYVKLGHLVFFDIEAVREALARRHTVRSRV